ncbi:helix-turn-helix domain-containing protein [Streptococcus ictaluri]|nr:helix-turn-helix domain-containing protein [Streptococcus ictaluri]
MTKDRSAQYQMMRSLHKVKNGLALKDLMTQLKLSKVTLIKYIDQLNHLFKDKEIVACLSSDEDSLYLEMSTYLSWTSIQSLLLEDSLSYQNE